MGNLLGHTWQCSGLFLTAQGLLLAVLGGPYVELGNQFEVSHMLSQPPAPSF